MRTIGAFICGSWGAPDRRRASVRKSGGDMVSDPEAIGIIAGDRIGTGATLGQNARAQERPMNDSTSAPASRAIFSGPVTTPVLPAATVVVLRDGEQGLEVLMLRRHVKSDVLGG